jgi:class 3 adenylate cyclase
MMRVVGVSVPSRSAHRDDKSILRGAVESHGGVVVKSTGDGMLLVFASAYEAFGACVDAQRGLREEAWPERTGPVRVRMGVHAGEAELRVGDYYGSVVNRAARLTSVDALVWTLATGALWAIGWGDHCCGHQGRGFSGRCNLPAHEADTPAEDIPAPALGSLPV